MQIPEDVILIWADNGYGKMVSRRQGNHNPRVSALPLIEHNHYVKKGDLIGEVVDPFEGTVKQQIRTAKGGLLFTLRAYPVVYEGDLLARILTE